MANLKLSAIEDDKPVKLTLELPAGVHRDLVAYAELLSREGGAAVEPARLFMATDREFSKRRRSSAFLGTGSEPS